MTAVVVPRENRPFKWRTCANCEMDSFFVATEQPPMACGWCLEPFPVPDGVHDDSKLVARIARLSLYVLASIGVAILVLNAVRP